MIRINETRVINILIEILMLLNTYIVWLFSLELGKNTKESIDGVVRKEKMNEKY